MVSLFSLTRAQKMHFFSRKKTAAKNLSLISTLSNFLKSYLYWVSSMLKLNRLQNYTPIFFHQAINSKHSLRDFFDWGIIHFILCIWFLICKEFISTFNFLFLRNNTYDFFHQSILRKETYSLWTVGEKRSILFRALILGAPNYPKKCFFLKQSTKSCYWSSYFIVPTSLTSFTNFSIKNSKHIVACSVEKTMNFFPTSAAWELM